MHESGQLIPWVKCDSIMYWFKDNIFVYKCICMRFYVGTLTHAEESTSRKCSVSLGASFQKQPVDGCLARGWIVKTVTVSTLVCEVITVLQSSKSWEDIERTAVCVIVELEAGLPSQKAETDSALASATTTTTIVSNLIKFLKPGVWWSLSICTSDVIY